MSTSPETTAPTAWTSATRRDSPSGTSVSWTYSVKDHNQDAVHAGDGLLVVVDGATPLRSEEHLGRATSIFAAGLVRHLAGAESTPVTLVEDVCAALTRAQEDHGNQGVTATISAVAWDDDSVRVVALGDSPIIVDVGGSPRILIDPAFTDGDAAAVAAVRALVADGTDWPEAYRQVGARAGRARKLRNTPAGKWVVSDSIDPDALLPHLWVEELPRAGVRRLAVASDGAAALVDTFAVTDWPGLLDAAERREFDLLATELYHAELADPERCRQPRMSYRDDASLAFARLS